MISGGCLCGGVRFLIAEASGPFELCHCRRCRKATGSAFAAGIYVARENFELLQGMDLIQAYEASIREAPPAYRRRIVSEYGGCIHLALQQPHALPVLQVDRGIEDHLGLLALHRPLARPRQGTQDRARFW